MLSVAKPWLICGYHGLSIVTMFFFVVKPWFIFVWLYPIQIYGHFFEGLCLSADEGQEMPLDLMEKSGILL